MRRTMRFGVMAIVLAAGAGAFLPVGGTGWAGAAAADKSGGPSTREGHGQAATGTFEVYSDKSGGWRWRLKSKNGQVIATSGQGYAEKRSCMDGIEAVKRAAADAQVKEVEAKDGAEAGRS